MNHYTTNINIEDKIFYLHHIIRRPLSNIVGISELMTSKELDDNEKKQMRIALKKTLEEFDQLMVDFDHVLDSSYESMVKQSA